MSISTTNPSIGTIITSSKAGTLTELSWNHLKEFVMSNEKIKKSYKEIWIPRFSLKCETEEIFNINRKLTSKKYLMSISETGSIEFSAQTSHKGKLIPDNLKNVLILDTSFYFSIFIIQI